MKYTKIGDREDDSENQNNDKKIELIDKQNSNIERNENTKNGKLYNNSNKYGIFIIIILLILFLFLLFIYQNNVSIVETIKSKDTFYDNTAKTEEDNELSFNEKIPAPIDVFKIYRFKTREKAFKKAKNFLDNCIKGNLIRSVSRLPKESPIASAVIPVYNSKSVISRAIKSIQNQNILNLEIILVEDNSTDDTLPFIKDIQKTDPRIKIITNKKNMGTLYSRCIGVLSAKGKYIFPLDNDDMFLDEDVFKTITNIAEKGNFDIVEFRGIQSKKGKNDILNNKRKATAHTYLPLNSVLYQPTLGNYQIWRGQNFDNLHVKIIYLWAKCIRTEIYVKTIKKMGVQKYSAHIVRYEDVIFNYALCNTARSYKFVGKYGIFNIYRKTSASRYKKPLEDVTCYIFYLEIMIKFVQDRRENKVVLVYTVIFLLANKSLKEVLDSDVKAKTSFFTSIDKVLNMTKISKELKDEIRKKGRKLPFIDYKF